MIVIDASAALELVGNSGIGIRIAGRISGEALHAPYLLDLEVTNALRRQSTLGSIQPDQAEQALIAFLQVPTVRHDHRPLLGRIWDLRNNFTTYDACYLALTEALGATLLTRDSALSSARLRQGTIEVI